MSNDVDHSDRGSTEIIAPSRTSRKRWAAPKVISSKLALTAGGSVSKPETSPPIRGIKPVS
jgi:hypothetical protein